MDDNVRVTSFMFQGHFLGRPQYNGFESLISNDRNIEHTQRSPNSQFCLNRAWLCLSEWRIYANATTPDHLFRRRGCLPGTPTTIPSLPQNVIPSINIIKIRLNLQRVLCANKEYRWRRRHGERTKKITTNDIVTDSISDIPFGWHRLVWSCAVYAHVQNVNVIFHTDTDEIWRRAGDDPHSKLWIFHAKLTTCTQIWPNRAADMSWTMLSLLHLNRMGYTIILPLLSSIQVRPSTHMNYERFNLWFKVDWASDDVLIRKYAGGGRIHFFLIIDIFDTIDVCSLYVGLSSRFFIYLRLPNLHQHYVGYK